MLNLLKISNIALIADLQLEFSRGLNLLTGETGSGKSIIVDALGGLIGERISSDLIKDGETSARIEGLFSLKQTEDLLKIIDEAGLEIEDFAEVIVRRELSLTGKNRSFINNQLVTQSFLKKIGAFFVDIHGQGEQQTLFNPATHLELLDDYAGLQNLREDLAKKFHAMSLIEKELEALHEDETQKLQLLDILQFQIEEIRKVNLQIGEDEELESERKRLNNIEKLSGLSETAFDLLYENEASVISNLGQAARKIDELAGFENDFSAYTESLANAQAVVEDLAIFVRNFRDKLEFSPERLSEIENRLVEVSRLKRKYGGAIETVLAHFNESTERLSRIETADLHETELKKKLAQTRESFLKTAQEIHDKRVKFAQKFAKEIETNLKAVALERAKFEVRVETSDDAKRFSEKGFDTVEFYFSANAGESPKPLAKVASGGEASRLMLILKTTATPSEMPRTVVFDEIDSGVGGRVAEAVGLKLKQLSQHHQVLCVTHQPQVASLADFHYLVSKEMKGNKTSVKVSKLTESERVEEIARMLAGEKITDSARTHAREMIKTNS